MREWKLSSSDAIAPRIAADARAGRTNYRDDQVWQLRLGKPDEPAITLETRYGGRVGLARVVPQWWLGQRQVYEAQGYHTPPVITAFTPDYLRLHADLTLSVRLTYEFWVMESQAVGGRMICHNTSDQPQPLKLDLNIQAVREDKSLQIFFLTLENNQVALQLGRMPGLQPVLMLEGALPAKTTAARLDRALTLAPGQQVAIRWVLASQGERDSSLLLAHKWLNQENWADHLAAVEARANAAPQIETGHPDWDVALAWSQQLILRSFLAPTGSLPNASFVTARRPDQGFAAAGSTYGGGFFHPWGGQSVPEALLVAPSVAFAAPELAKGVIRNFLAAQREDGWIDARPGLEGQRANVIAPPLLATLTYAVYNFTRDKDFLAECLDRLVLFFNRWFLPDQDRDSDGVPEWTVPEQGAFADSPTLARGRRWALGIDSATIEAPDLLAHLVREARTLLGICKILENEDTARAIRPRFDTLKAALDSMWDAPEGVFHYRDRDSHASPGGEVVFTGKGDQPLNERIEIPQPSRLVLRVSGGVNRKPNLGCTIEGVDASGKSTNESLPAAAFDWYRNMGVATTKTVWREIKYLKFDGLSRVFKIEVNTVNLAQHDQALLMPLWSGTLDAGQVDQMVAMMSDPALYGRPVGVCACPANAPVYDASMQNGCGGVWPDWNARLGWALLEAHHPQESAALFKRLIAAQARCLAEEKTFRSIYHPDSGAGLGDTDTVQGVVSLGWFGMLFGANVLNPGAVAITGPFALDGETIIWTQHGVRLQRSSAGIEIVFPTGHTAKLPPDADPQMVRDPKAISKPAAPPPPKPPAVHPDDDDLMPDDDS